MGIAASGFNVEGVMTMGGFVGDDQNDAADSTGNTYSLHNLPSAERLKPLTSNFYIYEEVRIHRLQAQVINSKSSKFLFYA